MWIWNTGANTHMTWSNNIIKNVQGTKMYSLGYAGGAIESTAVIDFPGVLWLKMVTRE